MKKRHTEEQLIGFLKQAATAPHPKGPSPNRRVHADRAPSSSVRLALQTVR
jgi:hypothetical protein